MEALHPRLSLRLLRAKQTSQLRKVGGVGRGGDEGKGVGSDGSALLLGRSDSFQITACRAVEQAASRSFLLSVNAKLRFVCLLTTSRFYRGQQRRHFHVLTTSVQVLIYS